MTTTVLLALLAAGVAVGFLSGLIGIGGGVLIVPFLYFFYEHPAWSGVEVATSLEAAIAHATSLAIIVPTAIQGTITYQRAGLVAWRAVLPIALASIVAAVAGARLALLLPGAALKLAFGVLLLAAGTRLIWSGDPAQRRALRLGLPATLVTGALVGLFSALLGVGGGLIAIPMLIHVIGLDLERVSATSLAVIVFAAAAGTVTYVISGRGAVGLPPGSWGYVHLAAAFPMLTGSLLAVRWGAWLNQRLHTTALRALFGLLFIAMGIRLVAGNAGVLF